MFDTVKLMNIFRMVMDKLVEMNYKKLWEELMTICGKKF